MQESHLMWTKFWGQDGAPEDLAAKKVGSILLGEERVESGRVEFLQGFPGRALSHTHDTHGQKTKQWWVDKTRLLRILRHFLSTSSTVVLTVLL